NHYLDLSTVKVHRFWPTQELPRLTLRQAAHQGATLLKGMMQSAGTRFPLSVSITAGWDSRVVLAATRDVKTEVSYFTFKLANARTANADLTVPARLLAKLGKVHRVLEIPDHMDPEFQKIYRENAAMAHEYWGTVAEALLRFIPPSHVRVSGNGSETVRQQFRPTIDRGITPEKLAEWAATREKFALDAFAQWLD